MDGFVFVVKAPHALSSNATTRAMAQDRRPSSPRRSAPEGGEGLLYQPVFDGIARQYHLRFQVRLFPAKLLGRGSCHALEQHPGIERGREDVADLGENRRRLLGPRAFGDIARDPVVFHDTTLAAITTKRNQSQ